MDPVLDNEWLGSKNDSVDEAQNVGNVVRSWQWRERGIDPLNSPPNKTVLENVAEDILVQKPLKIRCCDLPGYPRSTYLMVFSPDGTKVASTHGNHNVYVSELASGKHVRILKGHPRTPWCIAFHPSHPQLIGSGCLGGQVRVWDISSGGSEVWNVRNETVIASIAFHPREQLLVIGTYNELYFWDWSQPAPFTKVSTNNINEKVRYVAFDSLGYKLITGISLRATVAGMSSSVLQQNSTLNPMNNQSNVRRDDTDNSPGNNRPQDNSGSTQDIIVNSYQNLVQRYDSLVRNYQRLFMVRHRLTATPPPPSTMDRGTDPMETDPSPEATSFTRTTQTSQSSVPQNEDENPPSSSSNNSQENAENEDGEGSSRLLNLDALSFDSGPARERNLDRHVHSLFGSRPSAFHPLNDNPGRSFRTVDQNERASRLLPNPFSSTSGSQRPSIFSIRSSPSTQTTDNVPNTSRTSIFPAYRPDSPSILDLSPRRWSGNRRIFVSVPNENSSTLTDNVSPTNTPPVQETPTASAENSTQRPSTSYSSSQTQSSTPVDAQTINESLDLIRDILRDSGTRLLNLITNMSLSTLASVEDELPRRTRTTRTQSDNNNGGETPRETPPRARIFSSHLRPGFLSTSSESDSDQSPEVNIFRTRNSTFREDDATESERATAEPSTSTVPERPLNPTDRLVFDLDNSRTQNANSETGGINVSANSSRFRVRTQSNAPSEGPSTSNPEGPNTQENQSQNNTNEFNPNRPSTSRDNFWANGCVVPPDEAFRKVRVGVSALQKHTMQLTNMWLRGNRTTMPELRNMWENLRRRILMLHRETGRQDLPSYYTRSLLERCMMLTEITERVTRSTRNTRPTSNSNPGNSENARNSESLRDEPTASENTNVPTEPEQSTSRENTNDNRQSQTSRTSQTRPNIRSSPSLRRRLQSSYRWRPEDELRRRTRHSAANRLSSRYLNRPRRDFARAIEISATRHEIRMRAMQVLSVMFNMMMMCLEERGLSQLIINMLRTLKKALALTCLMLMTNRNNGRASNNSSPQRVDSLNVIRLENVDHTGPVNVDGPDESPHHSIPSEEDRTEEDPTQSNANKRIKIDTSATTQPTPVETSARENTNPPAPIVTQSNSSAIQAWSNRLAVQIAAANRNNSATARNRRELYIESRRLKALHKTNPNAHPMIKKKALPPASTYRIPTLRLLPSRRIPRTLAASRTAQSTEPVAGPSGILSGNDGGPTGPSRLPPDVMNEFEHRINLIRMAHMQAVRLRNAARSRFRRLQTIRLYTPSSVREMFTLQPDNENPHENRSPLQSNSDTNRRSFTSYDYRPHILTRERIFSRGSANRPSQESGEFHAVITNATVPLMQVGDLSINNPDAQGNQNQRLPRIHEYLQPIILAQNAMVVDDEGNAEGGGGSSGGGGGGGRGPGGGGPGGGGGLGGVRRMTGMAGLLDAGIISEALPASSHRVQAWDFTTGKTPDIADSSKNVVVQRCRIHNDASIDISKDGRLLVALLPVPRLRNTNHWLGVYSLEWSRLGQCLHTAVLEQSAVSVALSPTARHLAVGLGSRRFTTAPHARTNVFALLYRLDPLESSSRTGLSPIKELEQTWEHGFTSLNCLRWAPQPGQGLVYANNTGQLIIMS